MIYVLDEQRRIRTPWRIRLFLIGAGIGFCVGLLIGSALS
jgi:hypothetical protein